jgi:hypothetical protein
VALGAARAHRVDGAQRVVEQLLHQWGLVSVGGDALLDEVPVRLERLGERVERLRSHPRGEEEEQGALEGGVGEEVVAERAPAPVELHLRADLVEHLDARRQSGLDRVLGEQALGEAVEGADGRAVELVERGAAPGAHVVGGRGVDGAGLERPADAVAQLRAGLLGERDRRDRPQLDLAVDDERHDAAHELGRLPRPGPGFDEQRPVEVVLDRGTGRLVRRRRVEGDHVATHR